MLMQSATTIFKTFNNDPKDYQNYSKDLQVINNCAQTKMMHTAKGNDV